MTCIFKMRNGNLIEQQKLGGSRSLYVKNEVFQDPNIIPI